MIEQLLIKIGVCPNILMFPNPIKIYEYNELMKNVQIDKSDKILDLGCGNGFITSIISKKCREIHGVDTDCAAIHNAEKTTSQLRRYRNCYFHLSKLEDKNFEEGSFDKILSFCVVEHIDNYITVLKECHRILKPGGEILFSVDSFENINGPVKALHKEQNSVVKYFSQAELERLLKHIGFKSVIVYPILKSIYAQKFVINSTRKNRYSFSRLYSVTSYLCLKLFEMISKARPKGLFLVATCKK